MEKHNKGNIDKTKKSNLNQANPAHPPNFAQYHRLQSCYFCGKKLSTIYPSIQFVKKGCVSIF